MKTPVLFAMTFLLASCANSSAVLNADVTAADKQCTSQQWPSMVARVDCLDSVETPLIYKDAPTILSAFETFSSTRRALAQTFDHDTAPAVNAWDGLHNKVNELQADLLARESRWSPSSHSALNNDLQSVNFDAVCTSRLFVARMRCYDSIMRPIWERDAPDTLKYYDAYQKKRIELAKRYDASGAPRIGALAMENYNKETQLALDKFRQASETDASLQQQTQADWGTALSQGIASYAHARANSDAAKLNNIKSSGLSAQCGISPVAPVGCTSANAQCSCFDNVHCGWVFIGCGQSR